MAYFERSPDFNVNPVRLPQQRESIDKQIVSRRTLTSPRDRGLKAALCSLGPHHQWSSPGGLGKRGPRYNSPSSLRRALHLTRAGPWLFPGMAATLGRRPRGWGMGEATGTGRTDARDPVDWNRYAQVERGNSSANIRFSLPPLQEPCSHSPLHAQISTGMQPHQPQLRSGADATRFAGCHPTAGARTYFRVRIYLYPEAYLVLAAGSIICGSMICSLSDHCGYSGPMDY